MLRRRYQPIVWFSVLAIVLALMPVAPQVARAATTVRWGYYVTYADTSADSLRQRVDILTHVSPWYFNLNADGTLSSMEEPETTAFIRSRNVRVVPMIQNIAKNDQFAQMLNTPEKMDAVVDRIAQIGLRPEYAGVHIDFEGLGYAERPVLTEFMARLAARLRPANKLVTQAIPAKTGESAAGWAAAFDYPALAQHTDLVVIMAYDYHYATGSPGAVAPIDWVARVANYAARTFGPQKTILGMPLYGYAWPVNKKDGERAASVSYSGAIELLDRYHGQRGYDERQESEWGRLRRDGVDYEMWFESGRSLKAKMEVMQNLNLAGFGGWRLGHEDPAFWDVVREYATPASPHPRVADTRTRRYFPETRHTLEGKFLEYWTSTGGLARYGFPLTEPFEEVNPQDGQTYTVQYFERARFEHHPELAGTPYEVLLGHIGRWALERSGSEPPAPVVHAALNGGLFFPETGRVLDGGFRSYWEQNGGLMQFGLPITDEFDELNPDDGQVYTVQYFERARFEYHPEHQGTPYEVLLGLLGRQMLRDREWIQ